MESLLIKGLSPLKGSVGISGSKNAVLPIMAATVLCSDEVILSGVPDLEDIKVMAQVLKILGAKVKKEKDVLIIDSSSVNAIELPDAMTRKMRASNLVMGPLLGRFHHAKVAYPGGCAIGSRPVNLHLKGFCDLGFDVKAKYGFMEGKGRPWGGKEILLDTPSVGATENIMMAASLVSGETVIRNAAREPEIIDLQNFLNRMGAKIRGAGLDTIYVEGVKKLGKAEYRIIPDRIEAGTFIAAAAISNGDVLIENVVLEYIRPVISKFREMGVNITESKYGLRVTGNRPYKPVDIKTIPHPGYPTDMQAQMMALLTTVAGTSIVVETIFENRFMHVQELRRMGAEIALEGRAAIIKGKEKLEGAIVDATDLRAGAALIIAALFAEGVTQINNIYHIERGYENIHLKLESLGADIKRALL
ncbi:MAG: UDP-N-acetylglucosamine 1-carboxyvinyltransferase [Syntrophomonadaceae bacterium]|nr:UDP-N-acetylglucosamine 1-carboxyvinyltransferase [Syntrophomonadaceae bacterium]